MRSSFTYVTLRSLCLRRFVKFRSNHFDGTKERAPSVTMARFFTRREIFLTSVSIECAAAAPSSEEFDAHLGHYKLTKTTIKRPPWKTTTVDHQRRPPQTLFIFSEAWAVTNVDIVTNSIDGYNISSRCQLLSGLTWRDQRRLHCWMTTYNAICDWI